MKHATDNHEAEQMNQQCGNCKFWDRDNIIGTTSRAAPCLALIPDCARVVNNGYMGETEGQNCPVYEERKEWKE